MSEATDHWNAMRKMHNWTVSVAVTRQGITHGEVVRVQARTRGEAERIAESQLSTMGYGVEARLVHDEGEVDA